VTNLVSTSAGPAHLHVTNGAADGSARLIHGSIGLNGIEVVGPEDLGADVALVDRPVTLLANNVLTVTLTGPVGGTLEVTLERRGTALTSVTPASGRQGETLTVAVVGSNTHFAQGTTLLFAGRGVSVGGAPPGTFGPVTVQDATHLTATLTLGATPVLGPRLLLAKTNGERAALFPGVTVLAATPAIPGTTVTTLAGTGTPGLVDGAGTTAQFRLPADIAARADGSAVVADTGNSRLREVAPDGTVSTVALPVSLLLPTGVTIDASGRTVLADTARCVIRIVNPDDTVTTLGSPGACTFADGPAGTARFRFPRDVAADAAGTLYVADTGNFRVRKIDPQGNVTTLAGTGTFGGTDGPATSATFGLLTGIALAEQAQGPPTVFVSDAVFQRLRQIASDGTVSPLAGTGTPGFADGPALSAQLAFPTRLTRDPAGHLYFADTLNNLIRRLTPQGTVETVAGTGAWGSQDGPGGQATFTVPVGVGVASAAPNTLFVADTFSHKVRVIQVGAAPTITALDPTSAVQGDTLTLTVTGTNLIGATALSFLRNGAADSNITATDLSVNLDGTALTATVTLALTALPGPRTVTVTTPSGTSDPTPTPTTTFTVLGRLTLIPTFQQLPQGSAGGLTVETTTPAPPGGLAITLASANATVATVPSPVTIPEGATSILAPVTAVGEGSTTLTAEATGYATATAAVTVVLPSPTIQGFSPTSGPVDTAVTITGGPFSTVTPSGNTVTFTGPNSTRLPAPVTTLSSTQLSVTVPAGAVTGPVQVTTTGGTATSTGHFVVLPSPDFTLGAVPATGTALQGGQATFALSVSGVDGFTGLVSLALTGLPAGVAASLEPPTLAPGQGGRLTLTVGGSVPTGSAALTLTGTSPIAGAPRSHSVSLTLGVEAGGRTALSGQVLLVDGTPLPGVRLTLAGLTTTTDAAGAFLLLDLPAGTQPLSVDANVARPGFPIYGVDVTLVAGQLTTLPPFRLTPPPPPERFTPIANGAQDQLITDPRFPGFALTLPAGVTITGWDGTVKTQVAIDRLTPDRLPVPAPPFATEALYQIFFGTPMGGVPSAPLPVTVPNDQDAAPGEQVTLWYYDAAPFPGVPAGWRQAGSATVSADGKTIVSNPGVGIQRFCGVCGVLCIQRHQERQATVRKDGPRVAEPVDPATGLFLVDQTDLVLPGRLPLALTRSYNPLDPFGQIAGVELGLGPHWALSVDIVVLELGPSLRRLILPGNARLDFPRQPDGTFANGTAPQFTGAVLTHTGNTHTLRFKDGATWRLSTGYLPRVGATPIAGFWLLTQQTDRVGNALTITRDGFGGLARLTEPAGRTIEARFTGARLTTLTDPAGRTVTYAYDAQGRLSTVTDPAGGLTRYTYDAAGRITTITDPRSIVFLTNTFSPGSGRILTQTQADGGVWTFRYSLQGATVSGPGCPGPSCPTEESAERIAQGYTVSGGVITATTVTDPRGNPTTHRFGPDRLPREIVDGLGQATTVARDAAGRPLTTTDPLGRATTFTYDAQGNVTTITDPLGNLRTFTYDPTFHKVTSLTDPLGNLTTFEYDAQGNLVAITDPEQNQNPDPAQRLKTRMTYNSVGQPLTTTDPLGNVTTFAYDAHGNLASISDPLGNTTTRTYDAASRLLTQTDPRGKQTQFGYDPLNRLTRLVDPLQGVTAFTYDGNGNLLTVTDARGSVTTHEYDPMDRLSTRTDPLNRAEAFTYDGVGNLLSTTDRRNQGSTFTYDPLNRRVTSTFADGATATFTYDAAGRLLLADDTADPHRPIALTYDAVDRLLAETTALGTVAYQYDPLGRRTQMTVAGQPPVAYAYDAASRLTQLVQEPLAPVTLQYDASGRRTLLTLPNQVSTESQYDPASRLTALLYRNALGPLGDLTYSYDAAGNRIGVGGTFSRTLLPDPIPTATYDAANQQPQFGAKTMTFDANGNLATLTDPTGSTTFTWDARNRLTALSGPSLTGAFAYDAHGRRARREVGGELREDHYDGVDVIRGRTNGEEVGYVRALNIDEPLTRDGAEFYLTDALGTTLALTDATGTLVTTYTYEPFGRTALGGAASPNSFQFTGRENDSSGLYYYRARYYHPGLKRFLTEDPIGLASGDTNYYAYVANNPIGRRDPLGLTWKTNARFLSDFFTGGGETIRQYGPGDVEIAEMQQSIAAQRMRAAFVETGCEDQRGFAYDTFQAYWDTIANPFTADLSSTATQVGGFAGASIVKYPDGTITITIPNEAGAYSFFYHLVPNAPWQSGPFRTIRQTFQWTEPAPLGCRK
jgi:RHS repeat-associated protein